MRWHTTALALIAVLTLTLGGCSLADDDKGKAGAPGAGAVAPVPTGPTPMDTFRAMAPPEGMKFTPLFATPVKNDDERFRRLENSVQSLRNDFDTVVPTMVRLAAIEKDIRQLVGQMQTMSDAGPITEAAPVSAVEAQVVPPAQARAGAPAAPVPATASAPAAPAAPAALAADNVTKSVTEGAAPVKPAAPSSVTTTIPGKDIAGGTEPAATVKAAATGPKAGSLPVTPEAASNGKLPPDGAASPHSSAPAPAAAANKPAAPVAPAAPAAVPAKLPQEPLQLTPLMPDAAKTGVAAKPAPATVPVKEAAKKEVVAAAAPAKAGTPTTAPVAAPPVTAKPAAPVAPPAAKSVPSEMTVNEAAKRAEAVKAVEPAPSAKPTAPAAQQEATTYTPVAVPAKLQPVPPVKMGPIVGDVQDIRIGDHIDKTRIVLETTAKADYKAFVDNDGRRLIIQLPQYNWKTAARWDAVSANLVSDYSYADGTLVLDLMTPASISSQQAMPAGNGGQRIVIDLFAPLIHVK